MLSASAHGSSIIASLARECAEAWLEAEILTPVLRNDPDNVMTECGRGVIKTWSCWVAEVKGANFPHISQAACISREVSRITGEKLAVSYLRTAPR